MQTAAGKATVKERTPYGAAAIVGAVILAIYIVTIAPTALGAGPALFETAGMSQHRFELTEIRRYGEEGAGAQAARLVWHRAR